MRSVAASSVQVGRRRPSCQVMEGLAEVARKRDEATRRQFARRDLERNRGFQELSDARRHGRLAEAARTEKPGAVRGRWHHECTSQTAIVSELKGVDHVFDVQVANCPEVRPYLQRRACRCRRGVGLGRAASKAADVGIWMSRSLDVCVSIRRWAKRSSTGKYCRSCTPARVRRAWWSSWAVTS